MRMGWQPYWKHPFNHLQIALGSGGSNAAFIFLLVDNKPVIVEDHSGMFPCDETITKLRMLAG